MINPQQITKFDRTEGELEEFLLFAILVAGKNSKVQSQKLDAFLRDYSHLQFTSPLDLINALIQENKLVEAMKRHGLGQYGRLEKCFKGLVSLRGKLKTATLEELEAISGIGSKTSRFYLLHSRPNQRFAVLDTHILKFLRESGIAPNAPKATPSKKLYGTLEKAFLSYCDLLQLSPAEMDLAIWKKGNAA